MCTFVCLVGCDRSFGDFITQPANQPTDQPANGLVRCPPSPRGEDGFPMGRGPASHGQGLDGPRDSWGTILLSRGQCKVIVQRLYKPFDTSYYLVRITVYHVL